MAFSFDLPDSIPLFPLPNAVLLPRSRLPLHIFEPRYLSMVEDAMKTSGRLIGMIQPASDERLHMIGCAGRLTQFSETEDGRYMVTLTGVSRYRIKDEIEGFTPYRKFNVEWDGFDADRKQAETDKHLNREALFKLLQRYFDGRGLSTDWDAMKEAEDELLINSLSMLLDFEAEDKQALLEAPSLITRRETLITLIEYSLRSGTGEDIIQ